MQKLQVTNGVIKKYYIVGITDNLLIFLDLIFLQYNSYICQNFERVSFQQTIALSTFIVFTHYDCLILVNVHLMTRSAAQNVLPITKFDNDRHVKTVKI